MKILFALSLIAISPLISTGLSAPSSTNSGFTELTLERAMELALQSHPDLRESEALLDASKARASIAGTMPNPEAVVRVESAPLQGKTGRDAEYVAGISQRLPLGGRLAAAREVGRIEAEQFAQELGVKKLELRRKVQGAFATALYAQEYSQLHSNSAELVKSLVRITKLRLEAGDGVPSDLERVEVEALQSQLERQRIASLEERARAALAQAIGISSNQMGMLKDSLSNALAWSEMERLAFDPEPYLQLSDTGVRHEEARLKLATREKIPDLNLELFYRRLAATKQNAFDLGISIPLSVFGTSQGKIREAKADLAASKARQSKTRNEVDYLVGTQKEKLRLAVELATALRDEILPRSERIVAAARNRYQEGDLGLSELIARRKEMADLQKNYLESLRDVVETGRPIFTR